MKNNSRKIKNIMSILLIIIFGLSTYFTINYIKDNSSNTSNITLNNNQRTVPGNMEGNMGEPPERSNTDDNQSSDLPENNDDNQYNSQDSNNSQRPPRRDNFNDMPNMDGQIKRMTRMNNVEIDGKYYIILGIEALVISTLVIYLIMSNFNKKDFKKIFNDSDKIIIFILSSVILTAGIVFADSYIIKNMNNNNDKQIQMNISNQNNKATSNEINTESL